METKKIIKREIEEEVTDIMFCDNCNKKIEYPHSCGFGAEYHLSNGYCKGCGGESFDFCSLDCLKEFVNRPKGERE